MCNDRRPASAGGAALDLVREYQRRAGVTMETDNESDCDRRCRWTPVQEGDRQWDS